MPLVADVSHDESVVENDTAIWKFRAVGEKGGLDVLDCKRVHLPPVSLKSDAIETAAVASDRVANTAALEIRGRFGERLKA